MARKVGKLCLFGLLACFHSAYAQDLAQERRDVSDLAQIVITARGFEQPITQTPGGVGLISDEKFTEQMSTSITDALDAVAGVNKVSDSAWGSDINIRGRGRDSVVMLIDGARVNTATDINAQYGLIDPAEIERIEILKGPISSLYGSGTLGGVVNVITKSGVYSDDPKLSGEIITGFGLNPDGGRSFSSLVYSSKDYFSYISQSYRDYASYENGDSELVGNSQFDDKQSKIRFGVKHNDEHSSEAQLQYYEGHEIGIPGSGTAPLPTSANVTYPNVRRGLVQVTHLYAPSNAVLEESKLDVFYQYINRRARIDEFPVASPVVSIYPGADHNTGGIRWQNRFVLDAHTLVGGLDVWERRLDSSRVREFRDGHTAIDIPLPESQFRSSGAFLEDTWRIYEKLELSSGGRMDLIQVENEPTEQFVASSDDDTSWNAHVGATVFMSDDWSLTWIGARGYRSPSLEERYQYLQLGGGIVKLGDPNLEPEDSLFTETGVHYETDSVRLSVAGFLNSLDNLVSEEMVDESTLISANVAKARIYGAEVEARYRFSPIPTYTFEPYLISAYTTGRDTELDEYLPSIAPFQTVLGSKVSCACGLWGQVELILASRQSKVPTDARETPSWETLRLNVGYDFSINKTDNRIFVEAKNVFNETYRDHLSTSRGIDLTGTGRSLQIGYSMKF